MIKPIMKSFVENEFENGFIKLPKHKQELLFLKEKNERIKHKMFILLKKKKIA